MKSSKKAFTLVELIIVIAIIAILAVTAFLLLTKWLSKARDSSRASNLANIENSLQISLTENSSLPKPDSYTLIYASGTSNIVGYQGYFGEGVKDAVGNINSAPKDGDDYFTYYLNADLNKYQLAGFMENEVAYNPNIVSAVDYASRYVNVRGEKLGLLTDSNKSPLQSLGLTGLDILNTTSTYYAYFTNSESLNGTGKTLKSLRGVGYGLTNYWSFDETGAIAYDSMNSLDGEITGGTVRVAGKLGTGLQFGNTTSDAVILRKSFFNLKSDYTWVGWVNISNNDSKLTIYSEGTPNVTLGINYSSGMYNGEIIGATFKLINSGARHGFNSTNMALDKNKWYSLTFSFKNLSDDENSGIGKYYLDGKKISEIKFLRLNYIVQTQYAAIGNNIGGFLTGTQSKNSFPGLMDEVRIYNRALSDDEVKALYNATN